MLHDEFFEFTRVHELDPDNALIVIVRYRQGTQFYIVPLQDPFSLV